MIGNILSFYRKNLKMISSHLGKQKKKKKKKCFSDSKSD